MKISVWALGLTTLALAAPALGQGKLAPAVPAPAPAPMPAPTGGAKPLEAAPGAGPVTEKRNTTGGNDSITVVKSIARPKQSPGPIVPEWYSNAMGAIKAKRPALAIELMTPLLADFEKRYAEEKRKIFCAVTDEQSRAYLADAAKGAVAAVAVEPDWCRAQYIRGFALIELGNLDDALKVFRALTDLAPRNSRYLNELGFVLADMKKYPESVTIYRRAADAADLSPDGVNKEKCLAYRGIGYSLSKLGRLGDAEAAYKACLKIDPGNEAATEALEAIEKDRQNMV